MQAGLFQVVLAGDVADRQYIANVLNGWGNGHRNHEQDGAPAERGCDEIRHREPGRLLDGGGVDNAGKPGQHIAHDHAEHDWHQPEDALGPDRHHNGHGQGNHGNPDGCVVGHQLCGAVTGAARGHVYGQRGQAQADGHDHRGDHHRRQQAGDKPGAAQANRAGQDDVQDTCRHQAAEGFFQPEPALGGNDRGDKRKGRCQEDRDLASGHHVEDQGADTRREQGHVRIQPGNQRHQHQGAEGHQQHLGAGQRLLPDRVVAMVLHTQTSFCLVPKILSPASPRPGRM